MTTKPASTIMLFRQHTVPEVLLLRRSRQVGFFPSAWVFPGGKVDESDGLFPYVGAVQGLATTDNAFAIAAIRETFEESGLWIGQGYPDKALRYALNTRSEQLPRDGSLVADLDKIRLWSWWVTPETEPKRYDTKFFLTILDYADSLHVSPDSSETVEARWLSIRDAIALHEQGQLFMAPPTYITLWQLQSYTHVDAIWSNALQQEILPIQPIHDKSMQPMEICFPGHAKHPQSFPSLGCVSVQLQDGAWKRR